MAPKKRQTKGSTSKAPTVVTRGRRNLVPHEEHPEEHEERYEENADEQYDEDDDPQSEDDAALLLPPPPPLAQNVPEVKEGGRLRMGTLKP